MIEELCARVSEKFDELDGVIALRRTVAGSGSPQGTAPYLFQQGDDLTQLVLTPRYPMASIVSSIQNGDRKHVSALWREDAISVPWLTMLKSTSTNSPAVPLVGAATDWTYKSGARSTILIACMAILLSLEPFS